MFIFETFVAWLALFWFWKSDVGRAGDVLYKQLPLVRMPPVPGIPEFIAQIAVLARNYGRAAPDCDHNNLMLCPPGQT